MTSSPPNRRVRRRWFFIISQICVKYLVDDVSNGIFVCFLIRSVQCPTVSSDQHVVVVATSNSNSRSRRIWRPLFYFWSNLKNTEFAIDDVISVMSCHNGTQLTIKTTTNTCNPQIKAPSNTTNLAILYPPMTSSYHCIDNEEDASWDVCIRCWVRVRVCWLIGWWCGIVGCFYSNVIN